MSSINERERRLADKYCSGWDTVERRSDREFDVVLSGKYPDTHRLAALLFSSWLPLAVLHAHPEAWFGDDWSFTRDADPEDIWSTFYGIVGYR